MDITSLHQPHPDIEHVLPANLRKRKQVSAPASRPAGKKTSVFAGRGPLPFAAAVVELAGQGMALPDVSMFVISCLYATEGDIFQNPPIDLASTTPLKAGFFYVFKPDFDFTSLSSDQLGEDEGEGPDDCEDE